MRPRDPKHGEYVAMDKTFENLLKLIDNTSKHDYKRVLEKYPNERRVRGISLEQMRVIVARQKGRIDRKKFPDKRKVVHWNTIISAFVTRGNMGKNHRSTRRLETPRKHNRRRAPRKQKPSQMFRSDVLAKMKAAKDKKEALARWNKLSSSHAMKKPDAKKPAAKKAAKKPVRKKAVVKLKRKHWPKPQKVPWPKPKKGVPVPYVPASKILFGNIKAPVIQRIPRAHSRINKRKAKAKPVKQGTLRAKRIRLSEKKRTSETAARAGFGAIWKLNRQQLLDLYQHHYPNE